MRKMNFLFFVAAIGLFATQASAATCTVLESKSENRGSLPSFKGLPAADKTQRVVKIRKIAISPSAEDRGPGKFADNENGPYHLLCTESMVADPKNPSSQCEPSDAATKAHAAFKGKGRCAGDEATRDTFIVWCKDSISRTTCAVK